MSKQKLNILIAVLILLFSQKSGANDTQKVVLDAPDPCFKVASVEKNKVYLVSTNKNCVSAPGKLAVEINADIKTVFIFTDGKYWKEQAVNNDFNLDSMNEFIEKTAEITKKTKVPENVYKEKGQKDAEKLYEYVQSESFQKKLDAANKMLLENGFGKQFSGYYAPPTQTQTQAQAKTIKTRLLPNERLYIFISSSIPIEVLRSYAASLDKLKDPNITMVLRGFVGGMKYIRPTLSFANKIISKDPGCDPAARMCEAYKAALQIDPMLFDRYGIEMVPAIAYVRGVNVKDRRASEGLIKNVRTGEFSIMYGDSSLEYILDRMRQHTKSKSLENVITALRKGFYDK